MYNPFILNFYRNMFKGFYYTIQDNENLEIIAKRYGVPVNNIININKLTYPYTLKEGDKLFIPGIDEPISPQKGSIYTVRFGDTIESISKRYSIGAEDIMKANYINNSLLFVGQKIIIPSRENEEKILQKNKQKDVNQNPDFQKAEPQIKIYSNNPDNMTTENIKTIVKKFSMLKRGSRGKEVIKLQRLLSALGYSIKRSDEVFGAELEKHILDVQKKAGLETNGVVDEKVWEYIFEQINKTPAVFK